MRPRVDAFLFWLLSAMLSLGIGCWWITKTIDQAHRAEAFFGMLVVAALAARAGMERPR